MKILSNISNIIAKPLVENNVNYTLLYINENSYIAYKDTNKSNFDILSDLLENKAYASALLFLNEEYELDIEKSSKDLINKDSILSYYKECENLLYKNIKVVEDKGIPLTNIKGYKIYESDRGIIRGNGNKKLLESFNEIDLDNITLEYLRTRSTDLPIKDMSCCPKCNYIFYTSDNIIPEEKEFTETKYDGFDRYHDETHKAEVDYVVCPNCHHKEEVEEFPFAWVDEIEDAPNAEELVPGISNIEEQEFMNEEGTQAADIAPKIDQGEVTPAKPKKKYNDLLISDLDESANNLINKGFLKNSKGQYQRGNFILVKEGDKYFAIRKDLIKEENKNGKIKTK